MPAQIVKRGKRPDQRPARIRYWANSTLRKNKVRHIVRSTGLHPREAQDLWEDQRKGRTKKAKTK